MPFLYGCCKEHELKCIIIFGLGSYIIIMCTVYAVIPTTLLHSSLLQPFKHVLGPHTWNTAVYYKVLWPIMLLYTTYGLTRDSILNQSRFFHVTEGLSPYCMHDLLEGTLQYEIKEMLKSLTHRKLISLHCINSRICKLAFSDRSMLTYLTSYTLHQI